MTVAYASSPSIVTNDFGGAGGTHTAAAPSSLGSGDLWTVALVADANPGEGTCNAPSGWTKAYDIDVFGTYPSQFLFWRVTTGSESAQAFVFGSGVWQVHSQSSRWTGTFGTAPIGTMSTASYWGSSTNEATASFDPGNLIVGTAGSMIVEHLAAQKMGGAAIAPTMSTDMTTIYTRGSAASGIYDKGGLAYLSASTAGTYSPGNITFSGTGLERIASVLFEIVEAGGAAPTSVQVDRVRAIGRGLGRGLL